MALQLTLSCDSNHSETGPTLVHSTGVQHYKIPPEVIRLLQENLSNDRLSDHDQGVLCQDGPQRVLSILRNNGFTLQKQTTDKDKALWTLVQGGSNSGGGAVPPPHPHPDPHPEDKGEEDEGGDKEEEEAAEEEETEE